MANEGDMRKAMEIEKQLRNRRQLKSTSSQRPYFSSQEASEKYEEAANRWLSYIDSLRSNEPNYKLSNQYVKNALEDLKFAKRLAYDKQERARIEADIDNVRSRLTSEEPRGDSLEKRSVSAALLQRAHGYLAIISFAGALLAISLKFTGSVIGPSSANTKWIGLCLFLVGCMFTFFYFRAKRK
jgi:hypothetical protein